MAIALLIEFKGGTLDQYDAVIREMHPGGLPYKDGVFHIAGPTEDGLRIVDVWEVAGGVRRFRTGESDTGHAEAGHRPAGSEGVASPQRAALNRRPRGSARESERRAVYRLLIRSGRIRPADHTCQRSRGLPSRRLRNSPSNRRISSVSPARMPSVRRNSTGIVTRPWHDWLTSRVPAPSANMALSLPVAIRSRSLDRDSIML